MKQHPRIEDAVSQKSELEFLEQFKLTPTVNLGNIFSAFKTERKNLNFPKFELLASAILLGAQGFLG